MDVGLYITSLNDALGRAALAKGEYIAALQYLQKQTELPDDKQNLLCCFGPNLWLAQQLLRAGYTNNLIGWDTVVEARLMKRNETILCIASSIVDFRISNQRHLQSRLARCRRHDAYHMSTETSFGIAQISGPPLFELITFVTMSF